MNHAKKLISLLLALLMVMSMAGAMAEAADTFSITINNKNAGHTYEAYQIFKGDISNESASDNAAGTTAILANIEWGNGVTYPTDGYVIGKDDNGNEIKSANAADVAEALSKGSLSLDSFISGLTLTEVAGSDDTPDENGKYVISGLSAGYYLIKDKDNSLNDEVADNAYTKFIIEVIENSVVNPKSEAPKLEKKIVEGETSTKVDANNGSIGDVVNYELTSKVPAMDGYDKYYFIVHDTLSVGLTFNPESLAIKIGEKTLVKDTDYTLAEENGQIKIVFNSFVQYKEQAGQSIVITYSATINENAVVGSTGNPNSASLEYSNNPNVDLKGENEPAEGDDDVTGKTPDDTVITYMTEIKIIKVDEAGNRLTGAEFQITGDKLNKVKVVTETFVEDAEGEYYALKDGSYTTTAPTAETTDKYKDTSKKYKLTEGISWNTATEKISATAFVGENGELIFSGLGEGTYIITELTAPEGYNKLDAPITVTITCTEPETVAQANDTATWAYEGAVVAADGTATVTIVNKAGATLPETGGVGTTMLYVGGGALIVIAIALLVSKKRKA